MPRTIDFKGTSEARAVCDPVFLAGLLQHANSAMCGDDLEMDDALPPDSANAKMECETKVARMNCRPNNMLRTARLLGNLRADTPLYMASRQAKPGIVNYSLMQENALHEHTYFKRHFQPRIPIRWGRSSRRDDHSAMQSNSSRDTEPERGVARVHGVERHDFPFLPNFEDSTT